MHNPLRCVTLAICTTALGLTQTVRASTVTSTADSGPGSLRDAIAAANNGAVIDFAPALNGKTITLTSGELAITNLQLTINASPLSDGITISGNNSSRIFAITDNANVSLNNLDLLSGNSSNANGGGIYAFQSQLTCVNITIQSCFSPSDGGGLWANNVTGSMDRCSFIGNDSGGFGGGIFFIGRAPTVQNSVISGNRAAVGGGIANLSASPAIINCTIHGNSGEGVLIDLSSAPHLRNTIVWGNRSGDGSIASQQLRKGPFSIADADVDYCLVEGSPITMNNLDGTLLASDPKFIRSATPFDKNTPPSVNSDLRVATTSLVLNVGDNASSSTSFDLAGKSRIHDTTIDLGAFEGAYVTFGLLHPSLNPLDDENGNNTSNFIEYASGIDPSGPDDSSVRPTISSIEGFAFLKTSQRTNAADVNFIWETSTNLEPLSWQNMVSGIHYTPGSTSYLAPDRQQVVLKLLDGGTRRFYRQGFSNGN